MFSRFWRVFLLCLFPWSAWADGKVFPRMEFDPSQVPIPDQRAMIHWADGMERLVIETSFSGPGSNFAWVVPLPASPEVEEATTGLFPTLRAVFQPMLVREEERWFIGFVLVGIVVWQASRREKLTFDSAVVSGLIAMVPWLLLPSGPEDVFSAGFCGLMVFLLVALVWKDHRDPERKGSAVVVLLLVLVIMGFVSGLMLPSLSKARGSTSGAAADDPDISILSRTRTERFDVTVVSSTNATALTDWLRQNGFAASPEIAPVVSNYVRQGWVFAATKLAAAGETLAKSTPPLSFRFATARPVYPMALTGVGSQGLQVELYVFGPGLAETAGWKAVRSQPVLVSADGLEKEYFGPSGTLVSGHPLLVKWLPNGTQGTLLRAKLSPSAMAQDVWLKWTGKADFGGRVVSTRSAGIRALNWASLWLLGVALVAFVVKQGLGRSVDTEFGWVGLVGGAVVAGLIWFSTPSVAVRKSERGIEPRSAKGVLEIEAQFFLTDNEPNIRRAPEFPDLARKHFSSRIANVFTRQPLRESDAPGDYQLRRLENGDWQMLWVDHVGQQVPLLK